MMRMIHTRTWGAMRGTDLANRGPQGLSLVKNLVEAMGGTGWFFSSSCWKRWRVCAVDVWSVLVSLAVVCCAHSDVARGASSFCCALSVISPFPLASDLGVSSSQTAPTGTDSPLSPYTHRYEMSGTDIRSATPQARASGSRSPSSLPRGKHLHENAPFRPWH
eukprot:1350309-Rhodomonas_salina.2